LWSAVLVSGTMFVILSHMRDVPGRRPFRVLNCAALVWATTSALQPLLPDLTDKLWMHKIGLIGSSMLAAAWCSFSVQFGLRKHKMDDRILWVLYGIPSMIMLAGLTNDWHGFVWSSVEVITTPVGQVLKVGNGPVVWILTAYSYLVFTIGTIILVWSSFHLERRYRTQSVMLMIAAVFPIAGDVVNTFRLIDLAFVDLTPVMISVSSLFVLWSMVGFGLFTVLPVAHDVLFRGMNDGGIVIDNGRHIVDMNARALALLGVEQGIIGEPVDVLAPFLPGLEQFLTVGVPVQQEESLAGEEPVWIEVSSTPLLDQKGVRIGFLLMLRDITAQKQEEEQRGRLMQEVRTALNNIRTLSGLLPICYRCKKVRDDKGYWKQVESVACYM
jgi:PAS domain S-box-containing protein